MKIVEGSHGALTKELEVSKLELQLCDYIHFQTNDPTSSSSYGLNSISAVLLQEWLCH